MMQTNLVNAWEAVVLLSAYPYGLSDLLRSKPTGGVIREGKLFVSVRDGVLIIPADRSYKRFISNTWYHDEDIAGL
jgi:hypothetical protein